LLATHWQKVALKKVKSYLGFMGIKFDFTNSCSITNFNLGDLLQVLIIVFHTNIPSFLDKSDMVTFFLQNFTRCLYVMWLKLHGQKMAYGVAYSKGTYNC
jgi:hypothetical protein